MGFDIQLKLSVTNIYRALLNMYNYEGHEITAEFLCNCIRGNWPNSLCLCSDYISHSACIAPVIDEPLMFTGVISQISTVIYRNITFIQVPYSSVSLKVIWVLSPNMYTKSNSTSVKFQIRQAIFATYRISISDWIRNLIAYNVTTSQRLELARKMSEIWRFMTTRKMLLKTVL